MIYDKIKNGVYIIAEMSDNHGGDINNAFKIVEEAAKKSYEFGDSIDSMELR